MPVRRRFSRAGGVPASARSAVISSSKRKYCTEKPSCTAFTPSPTHRCDLPTPAGQLRREQPVEEGVRRDLAAHRLAQEVAELLGGVAAAERRQPAPGRVDVKPRLRRAHRATSVRAA